MVSILRFIFGYVKLIVTGESPHEILNILLLNGISFWSIERRKNSIIFCLSVKDYKRIRVLRKNAKFKVKIKIINKVGLAFLIKKITRRKSIVFGLLIVLLILLLTYKSTYFLVILGILNMLC